MELSAAAKAVWGKTGAVSRDAGIAAEAWHPLIAHMIDTGNVAAWLWDWFLPEPLKSIISNDLPGGLREGRRLFCWLASLHDLGKASDFQSKSSWHAQLGRKAGLPFSERTQIPHSLVSAQALSELLSEAGWPGVEWPSLVLAGHHGVFPGPQWRASANRGLVYEHPGWAGIRRALFGAISEHLDVDVRAWRQISLPVPVQVAVTGAVILADWLASTESLYSYESRFTSEYPERSAAAASGIPTLIGLQDVWRPDAQLAAGSPGVFYPARWPKICEPRDLQRRVLETAQRADGPGLMIVEGPMGDGKTEAALAAAEVLAARTGAGGIFVGLPTQATANQMFDRVTDWLTAQGSHVTVTLAHGKAARKDSYRALLLREIGIDECDGGIAASRWLSGGKKQLLTPVVVGTVDQVLLAGVAARHVALRHLGLMGKIVVIDEVHAYDAYMSTILRRVLAWLGALKVPVILLSATLPSGSRDSLLAAYAGKSLSGSVRGSYPHVVWVGKGQQTPTVAVATASKTGTAGVKFEDEPAENPATVARTVRELLSGGGNALIIRNTVGRAQRTYRALAEEFGAGAVTLTHARFTAADRRAREQRLIDDFGPGLRRRPSGHVVVATQVAEQSLDVDFDVLISDLAPVDLLLQRLGRAHRHGGRLRPPAVRDLRMIVVGYSRLPDGPPRLPLGSVLVYGEHLLWRTAAVLRETSQIRLPQAIPDLIEKVYGAEPVGPDCWQRDLQRAADDQHARRESMELAARQIILPEPDCQSLTQIGDVGEAHEESDARVQATVRLGARSIEVIVLRASQRPHHARPVSAGDKPDIPLGEVPSPALIDVILDQALRLPQQLTDPATQEVFAPEAWRQAPWLSEARVLLLPADGPLRLGGRLVAYSPALGLEDTRA